MQHRGIHQVFEEYREELLRYLRAHGAGDAAEDVLQELWLKCVASPGGPVESPRNYLYRAATNLMIDRRRSEVQAQRREAEWSDALDRVPGSASVDPDADRALDSRHRLAVVEAELRKLPARALAIFRRHRLEGWTQRQVAAAMGLSVSTIEGDLRMVYSLLDELKRKLDEE